VIEEVAAQVHLLVLMLPRTEPDPWGVANRAILDEAAALAKGSDDELVAAVV